MAGSSTNPLRLTWYPAQSPRFEYSHCECYEVYYTGNNALTILSFGASKQCLGKFEGDVLGEKARQAAQEHHDKRVAEIIKAAEPKLPADAVFHLGDIVVYNGQLGVIMNFIEGFAKPCYIVQFDAQRLNLWAHEMTKAAFRVGSEVETLKGLAGTVVKLKMQEGELRYIVMHLMHKLSYTENQLRLR